MTYKRQQNIVIFTFLLIPVSLLLLLLIYPTFQLFRYSMTNWDGYSPTMSYVGLSNFKKIIFDFPDAWKALMNNGLYFIIHLCVMPLELIAAVLLNRTLKGSSFYRFTILMPYIVNGIAVAFMFSYIYSPMNGPLNELLKAVGLESWITSWMGNRSIVNYSLVVVSLWRFSGVHVVLMLAGLQSISSELYEAAKIDGANFWQQQWYVTLPGVRRVIEICLFLNVIGALLQYDIPLVITGGGPGTASSTFGLFAIMTAFKHNNYGLASALAVMLLLIIVVLSTVQNWLIREKGE
ncbi:sugar ABC transporter permease [Paenibacillus ferrarius]|uniref:Sugar ABC transporter permease n=1 Tax=Paenibacillus ferrarius TaxID=1469647 RepID=A0A1V4HHA1_9BACL|nr:sugar ABC transporter permease [Paenibacillus ferrarius]OPH56060.1 sugar ABC transporter permease [Paenibacillus ferrarius]